MDRKQAQTVLGQIIKGFEDGIPIELDSISTEEDVPQFEEWLDKWVEGDWRLTGHRLVPVAEDAGSWYAEWHYPELGERGAPVVYLGGTGLVMVVATDLLSFVRWVFASCQQTVQDEGHDYEEQEMTDLERRLPNLVGYSTADIESEATTSHPDFDAWVSSIPSVEQRKEQPSPKPQHRPWWKFWQ